ncbi:hypothetical protein ACVBE9_00265 [Eionea flava]
MYQLLIILFIVLLFLAIRHIKLQPPEKQSSLRWRYGLYALLGLAILLVMSGKLHWVAGAIAAIFPLLQRFFPLIMRALPFFKNRKNTTHHQKSPTQKVGGMDKEKALQIFGFDILPEESVIIQRHRELMQKNHPDRGGSDFLAAQINEAKEVLLSERKLSEENIG